MANTTFGEVDYNDSYADGNKKTNSKDLFLRLVEGDNEMRLVTAPYQYLTHKYKKAGDQGHGQKVGCSTVHGSCPLCALYEATTDEKEKASLKAKQRWFYGVIDRKTGLYKVIDVPWQVYSGIKKLFHARSWGDPTKYDINIVVDKGAPSGYYSVQPCSKEALSASDQILKDNADLDDLKRRCTPPTPEQVQKRMDWINKPAPASAPATTDPTATGKPVVAAAAKPATKVAPVVETPAVDMTDDDDDEFPAYDGN
jgi:hypothetical protein